MSPRRLVVLTVSAVLRLSGATRLLQARRRARGDHRIFILEYHGVDPRDREWEGTVSQSRFRRHLRWLKKRFAFTTVAGAAELLAGGALDRDWCVITFDDGYLNNYEGAFPVLRELGVPATVYVTTGFLDGEELWFDLARRALAAAREPGAADATPADVAGPLREQLGAWPPTDGIEPIMRRLKYLPPEERLKAVDLLRRAGLELAPAARPMSWDQVREMRDHGVEMGAHTVHHPILSRLDAEAQEAEIRGSVERLAEELGEPPRTFAMPNGSADDYDSHTLHALRRLGLAAACTTRRGSCAPGCDPLELPRLGVGSDTLSLLDARLAGVFDAGTRRLVRKYLPFLVLPASPRSP